MELYNFDIIMTLFVLQLFLRVFFSQPPLKIDFLGWLSQPPLKI